MSTTTTTTPQQPQPPQGPPHQQQQQQEEQEQNQRTTEAKTAFTASLLSVGANHDAELRSRAKTLHENASILEKQEADVARTTADLGKQNEQWEKVADRARDGLKEIGDVQNWAELIERDLLVLEETVRMVEEEGGHGGEQRESGDGNGDGEGVNGNENHGKDDGKKGGWLKWW